MFNLKNSLLLLSLFGMIASNAGYGEYKHKSGNYRSGRRADSSWKDLSPEERKARRDARRAARKARMDVEKHGSAS